MRRRYVTLLRLLAIALLLGAILCLLAALVASPWWASPSSGVCGRGGIAFGYPEPFYWQCYGPPLANGGFAVFPPVWDGVAFLLDVVVWYLVSLVLVFLWHRSYAPRRLP